MSTSIQGLPSNLTSPTPAPSAASASGASQDQFLKLLVAQLQNQDPLDPQKGADFVAQLAQFSSLEQATQTNTQLGAIAAGQSSSQRASLAGFIGKTITARTDKVTLGASGPMSLGLHLEGATTKTSMSITDAGGNVVRTIALGPRAAGDGAVTWDGNNDAGKRLPPGAYNVTITATAVDGSKVAGEADLRGVIDSVEFPTSGNPIFHVGGASVAPADIISVNG